MCQSLVTYDESIAQRKPLELYRAIQTAMQVGAAAVSLRSQLVTLKNQLATITMTSPPLYAFYEQFLATRQALEDALIAKLTAAAADDTVKLSAISEGAGKILETKLCSRFQMVCIQNYIKITRIL